MDASVNYFTDLYRVNVAEHIEKKNGFSYVSWPFAVAELRKRHPTATWEVVRFDGLPYLVTPAGVFVEIAVTVEGVRLSQIHPVLNHANKPIHEPNAFEINTSLQRALVKAIALHGLGLFVFAGEDLPEGSDAKGDLGKNAEKGEVERGVLDFRTAFNLDTEEQEIAEAVFQVHERIVADADLYVAIGEQLTPRERSAIKDYVHRAKTSKAQMMANGRAR
jgi:hypothetical protein